MKDYFILINESQKYLDIFIKFTLLLIICIFLITLLGNEFDEIHHFFKNILIIYRLVAKATYPCMFDNICSLLILKPNYNICFYKKILKSEENKYLLDESLSETLKIVIDG